MTACPRCGKVWRDGRGVIARGHRRPECDRLLDRRGEFASVGGVGGVSETTLETAVNLPMILLQAAGWSGRQAGGLILLRHAPTEDGSLVPVWVMAPAWMAAVIPVLPLPVRGTATEHPVTVRRLETLRRAGHAARARMATTWRLGGATAAVELWLELDRLYPPERR